MSDREFQAMPELPDDLMEAFDSMRLAIMRHRHDGWREISERDVLTMLELLVKLTAPAGGEPSFVSQYNSRRRDGKANR